MCFDLSFYESYDITDFHFVGKFRLILSFNFILFGNR